MRNAEFKAFIEDQLSGLRELACRAMFGGYGLYQGMSRPA